MTALVQSGDYVGPPGDSIAMSTEPVIMGYGPRTITSGSQLNQPAEASYPQQQVAGAKMFTAYRPNALHELFAVSIPANYGAMGNAVPYRHWEPEYSPSTTEGNEASVGDYPGPVPYARRPTWNNLTSGAPYNVEVITPNNMNPTSYQNLLQKSVEFSPAQTASIASSAEVLQ